MKHFLQFITCRWKIHLPMFIGIGLLTCILPNSMVYSVIIEKIAIRVNDNIITQLEFDEIWAPFEEAGYSTVHKNGVIKMLITFETFNQMAEEYKIYVSLESVEEQMDHTFVTKGLSTKDERMKYLKENGVISYPYFLRQQRYLMTMENYVSILQSGQVPGQPPLGEISDEDLLNYYNSHKDEFQRPEERRISHILILRADPETTENIYQVNSEKKELAKSILEKIKSGAGFRAMVTEHSQDPKTVVDGGDLGWFSRSTLDELGVTLNVRNLSTTLFSQAQGEISTIIDSRLGFHIFKVDEVKTSVNTSYEQVRSQIRAYLERQKYIEIVQEDLNKQVNQAKIMVNLL